MPAAVIGSASPPAAAPATAASAAAGAVQLVLVLRVQRAAARSRRDLGRRQVEGHARRRAGRRCAGSARSAIVDLVQRGHQRDAALARRLRSAWRGPARARVGSSADSGSSTSHSRGRRQQRARQADALALAAGQPVDPREQLVGQVEARQRRVRPRRCRPDRTASAGWPQAHAPAAGRPAPR